MSGLVYDLHLHPGPSIAPRWGDGARVYEAAVDAGVKAFVWKAHETHTVDLCKALPASPALAIPCASLNPWAGFDDVVEAIESGALWVWGTTMTEDAKIGFNLPLPGWWPRLAEWLVERRTPVVLGTGHLDAAGRMAFAQVAEASAHTCSITHSLYVPPEEIRALAAHDAVFELDCFTYAHPLEDLQPYDLVEQLHEITATDQRYYLTSDGGQAFTGNPFELGRRVIEAIEPLLDPGVFRQLTVEGPQAMVAGVGLEVTDR